MGTQPIACSPACPVLPVPVSGSRGSGSVCPGRPVSSAGGRTKRGWQAVKWLPVGQPCRLPALLLPPPSLPSRRAAAQPGPGRAALVGPRVPTSRCFGQSSARCLAPDGPSPVAVPSSRAWERFLVSFPLVVCYYCLLLSFPPPPVPSAGSLCPPCSAGSRNQTPSGPDAVCIAESCGSSSPVRGQSRAWISGSVRSLRFPSPVMVLSDPGDGRRCCAPRLLPEPGVSSIPGCPLLLCRNLQALGRSSLWCAEMGVQPVTSACDGLWMCSDSLKNHVLGGKNGDQGCGAWGGDLVSLPAPLRAAISSQRWGTDRQTALMLEGSAGEWSIL